MKTKLTLSVEKALLEKARKLTKNSDRSLSGIFEDHLREIIATRESGTTPVTDELSGILADFYAGKSYREMKEEMYKDKYGL